MADSDFNFISPVEHLHNVPSLTGAKDQEQRKRRRRVPTDKPEPAAQDQDEATARKPADGESHSIDYCA